jgi:predicted ArsR family transcriptional regulator
MDVQTPPTGDVLAQPTRARLFGVLSELKRPARTEELAECVGLHVNGVRLHLERLVEAGLLDRTRARQAVGRPYDEWAISPDAAPGGESPRAYADLSRWLARSIPPGKKRLREIEATGREIGRELVAYDSAPEAAAEVIQVTLAAMGFQPRRENGPDQRATFCLGNCPYRGAVHENQPVVCTMHRGITRGLLDVVAPEAQLVAFEPRDPDSAGCIIELDLAGPSE